MKIFIVCSKRFYDRIPAIKSELEAMGHEITLPNNHEDPTREAAAKELGEEGFREFKSRMLRLQAEKVAANDAVLVLNFDKDGQENYIGGATFLEIYKAFELGKKIYMYNDIPVGILEDELRGMGPIVIKGIIRDIGK